MEYPWEKNLKGRQRSNLKKVKEGKYFKQLIDMGLTPFTKEWKKQNQRLQKKWENQLPEVKKRHNEARNKRYYLNLEESRKNEREKKKKLREKNPEKINERQREYYHREQVVNAQKQRLRRWRREPHRAIRANTDLYLKGLLTYEQYIKSVDEFVARAEQIERSGLREGKRPREEEGTSGQSGV